MPTLTAQKRYGLALLAILLLWGLFVWPFFTPNVEDRGSLPSGDVDSQYYALARLMAARVGAGELPLWNPYSFGGSPFLAEPQAAALYPPRWLTLAIGAIVAGPGQLPFIIFELEIFAHLTLAAYLTFGFICQLTGSSRAGLVGGLVFAFSSFLTGYPMEQVSILEASVWLPALLWGVEMGVTGRRRGWWLATAALAFSFLAGSPQMTMYIGYCGLFYLFFRGKQKGYSWLRLLFYAGMWLCATALLVLAQAWPTLELMRLSPRASANFATLANGIAGQHLLELFVPRTTSLFAALYVGLLSLVLAIGALVVPQRHATTPFWAVQAIVALALSFGANTAVFGWAYLLVPGFNLFRSQERILLLWAFAIAILAALGSAALLDSSHAKWKQIGLAWRQLLFLLLLGCLIAYFTEHAALPAFTFAALIGLGVVALLAASPNHIGKPYFFIAIVALIIFDLFTINGRTVWHDKGPERHERIPGLVEPLLSLPTALLDVESGVQPNIGALLSLPSTRGASQLRLSRYETALSTLPQERWWDLWGVHYVATWQKQLALPTEILAEATAQDQAQFLHQLTEPLPRARLLFAAESLPDEAALWQRLAEPAYDPATSVLLESPLPQLAYDGSGTITQLNIGAESWKITLQSDGPALLRLSLPFYPGWRATSDGKPIKLYRADGLWTALPISSAGEHLIELDFLPFGWAIAAVITLLAWIMWAISLLSIQPKQAFDSRIPGF